jgi:predicted Zn-dependent protease
MKVNENPTVNPKTNSKASSNTSSKMKASKVKLLVPALLAAVLLTHCSCDFFGTAGSLLISENDEMKLGASFDSTLHATDSAKLEYPVYAATTPAQIALVAYVQNMGQTLLQGVPADDRPGYAFKFTLIDKDIENAFAVPGGYVYIYTGIIKKMKDESELAGVMGHEIAHVTQHHYRDEMAHQAAFSLLVQALLGNDSGKLAQLVAGSFAQLATLSVSRSKEAEADKFGTVYAGNISRNPLGIAKLFSRFTDEGSTPAWLSTHPASPDRVEKVTEEVSGDAHLKQLAADSVNTNHLAEFQAATQALR